MLEPSVNFDRAADFYDETRGFPAAEIPHVARLYTRAAALTAESRLIEIGVGTGRLALPVAAETGAHITGVDISTAMMQRLIDKRTTERIDLLLGDARQLPLPGAIFDAAVVTHVFHLIPNWETALAELARVLKPDGVLLFCWGDSTRTNPLWELSRQVFPRPKRVRDYDEFRSTGFLSGQGWTPAGEPHTHEYQIDIQINRFIDRLQGRSWSSTWHLTDEQHAEGMAKIREAAAEMYPDWDTAVTDTSFFTVAPFSPPR